MARKPKKAVEKTTPKPDPKSADNNDEFDDLPDDDLDGDVEDIDVDVPVPAVKSRDWRDVERLKEERRLKSLIEDDLDF